MCGVLLCSCFFFKQKTAYELRISDWSSDVCSSDLAVFDPYVKAANALPRVVLAPIFALWFGLGIWSKVALGFTLVFFIVFFNVYQGVKEASPTVLANARMLGMNERQLIRHDYWPDALTR